MYAGDKAVRGLVAVSEVDLHVDQGEIVSLIGPNGPARQRFSR